MVNNIAGEHSMTRDAPPPVRRPGKARVLTEAELDVELDIEAGVRDRDGHAHANAANASPQPWRRVWRVRVVVLVSILGGVVVALCTALSL